MAGDPDRHRRGGHTGGDDACARRACAAWRPTGLMRRDRRRPTVGEQCRLVLWSLNARVAADVASEAPVGRHGNPFVRRPVQCRFAVDGNRRDVTLHWRPLEGLEWSRRVSETAPSARSAVGARTLADGTRWSGYRASTATPKALLPTPYFPWSLRCSRIDLRCSRLPVLSSTCETMEAGRRNVPQT